MELLEKAKKMREEQALRKNSSMFTDPTGLVYNGDGTGDLHGGIAPSDQGATPPGGWRGGGGSGIFAGLRAALDGLIVGGSLLFNPGVDMSRKGELLKQLGNSLWTHQDPVTNEDSYAQLCKTADALEAEGGALAEVGNALRSLGAASGYAGLALSLASMIQGVATGNFRQTWSAAGSFGGGTIVGVGAAAVVTLFAPEATAAIFLAGGLGAIFGGAGGEQLGGMAYDNTTH